jgi:outer membrane protein OmpA-like peptidoglycan-associated protein
VSRRARDVPLNPYIALADLALNLGMVFLLFIPLVLLLGSRGWDDVRYRQYHAELEEAVKRAFPRAARPIQRSRNDAPGEQRWTFVNRSTRSATLFRGDTARLTDNGRRRLRAFAAVLQRNPRLWHRIRVESHTRQRLRAYQGAAEDASLRLSAERAAAVAQFLFMECHIPPNRLAISGRGHQDPMDPGRKDSEVNDRVDLLVISPATARRQ